MVYGSIANVKATWLNISDAQSDTKLTALLAEASQQIDEILRRHTTVPIASPTAEVDSIAEQWTAGLFSTTEAQRPEEREHPWIQEARSRLERFIDANFRLQQLKVEKTSYKTDYLKREETNESGDLVE